VATTEARPLADFVRELREARKLSQADLARATGLSRTYIKTIEDGQAKEPSARTLGLLARALETDLVELMSVSGAVPDDYHRARFESDRDLTMYLRRRRNLSEQSVTTIMRLIRLSELETERASLD